MTTSVASRVQVTRTIDRRYFIIRATEDLVPVIKKIAGRRWNDPYPGVWVVPYCRESWASLVAADFVQAANKPNDMQSAYYIVKNPASDQLIVRTLGTADDILKCRRIPDQREYSQKEGAWLCKISQPNIAYLRKNFPQMEWDGTTELIAEATSLRGMAPDIIAITRSKEEVSLLNKVLDEDITDYLFQTTVPYEHQLTAFKLSRHRENFALFMEQGTGKGFIIVHSAAYRFEQGHIDGLLVICPNSMKEPWVEEFATHLRADYPLDVFMWEAKTRHKAQGWINSVVPGKLRVLIMNFEAVSGDIGSKIAEQFLLKHRVMFEVDESSKIKSPSASRTKHIIRLGKLAKLRRIMTGTPVTQGPLDVFSQFKFLDPKIFAPYKSFYTFRNRYAVMGGFQGRQVVNYQYLDELTAKIAPHSYRVLKVDCLDLPPKVYAKRVVELTDEQRKIYDKLDQEMMGEIEFIDKDDGTRAVASSMIMHVITKVMRMQQVVGGFLTLDANEDLDLPTGKPMAIPGGNPKLTALMDIIDEIGDDHKVVIWARFRPELALISQTLREKYGRDSVIEFHGGVKNEDRQVGRRDFQSTDGHARFLVGQQQAGGIGTTFTAADYMIYFSNDYSLEGRLQSEDRFHRIGQTAEKCTIIDIVAKNTKDSVIVACLRHKKKFADIITGDPTIAWV